MNSENPPSSRARIIVPGMAFAVLILLMMLWLTGRFVSKVPEEVKAQEERSLAGVTLTKATRLSVPAVEAAVGTITPVYESEIASRVLGRVTALNVKAGQMVGKGEVLVRLDNADLRARLDQTLAARDAAAAEAEQARRDTARGRILHEQKAMTEVDWEKCQTRERSAAAEFQRALQAANEAQATMSFTEIVAPHGGKVVDKHVDVGDIAEPGKPLLTVYDPSRMQLVGSVRESLASRLKVGQPVQIQITSIGETCKAQVTEIVPEAEASSRSFSVKAVGVCGPRAYKGMFGRLLIPLAEEDVLVVPLSSIRRVGQLDIVDVAEGNALVTRIVQLGRVSADGQTVQVLSGLREGEQVADDPGETAAPHGQ